MEFLNVFGFVNRISCFVDKKKDERPKSEVGGSEEENEKLLASCFWQLTANGQKPAAIFTFSSSFFLKQETPLVYPKPGWYG